MVRGTHIIYSETYPTICVDKWLHILQDIYSPILIFIRETILRLILNLVINLVKHSKEHKHIPTVFYSSANIGTLVVPLSNDLHTIGCEGVDAFIQYIYAYVG